ncbi:hypothetical protein IFM89_015744 [Coptis chinensis]|uniref:Uncharacterized protein n=1 Tax=Coptis chinensis TaxID=261450 RepID=A0A835I590_9MAGN|nr:hypothetical protein IFM89_015744 [Coptis chinensis]
MPLDPQNEDEHSPAAVHVTNEEPTVQVTPSSILQNPLMEVNSELSVVPVVSPYVVNAITAVNPQEVGVGFIVPRQVAPAQLSLAATDKSEVYTNERNSFDVLADSQDEIVSDMVGEARDMFVEHTQAAEVIAQQTTQVVVPDGSGTSPLGNNRDATNNQAKRGRGRPKGFGKKRGRGLLETKVKVVNFDYISSLCEPSWKYEHNYNSDDAGRILIFWDVGRVSVDKVWETSQLIHCKVTLMHNSAEFLFTAIYASNNMNTRARLWHDMVVISSNISSPWCCLGDYNNVLFTHERVGDLPVHPRETIPFSNCLVAVGLYNIKSVGCTLTWTNYGSGLNRKWAKLDRCLANQCWSAVFPSSVADFLTQGITDHSPIMVSWIDAYMCRPPFKFSKFWIHTPEFKDTLQSCWSIQLYGSERLHGDRGTEFFYNAIKERKARNYVWVVTDMQQQRCEGQEKVANAFIEYYKSILG